MTETINVTKIILHSRNIKLDLNTNSPIKKLGTYNASINCCYYVNLNLSREVIL